MRRFPVVMVGWCAAILLLLVIAAIGVIYVTGRRTYVEDLKPHLEGEWPAYPGSKLIGSENGEWEVIPEKRGVFGRKGDFRFEKKMTFDVSAVTPEKGMCKRMWKFYADHLKSLGLFRKKDVEGVIHSSLWDSMGGSSGSADGSFEGPNAKYEMKLKREKDASGHVVTFSVTMEQRGLWRR